MLAKSIGLDLIFALFQCMSRLGGSLAWMLDSPR